MYVHKLIHIPHIHTYPYPHTCTRTHTHVRPALFAVLTRGVPRSSTYFVGAAMTLADMGVWALCSGPSPRMRCLIAGFGGQVSSMSPNSCEGGVFLHSCSLLAAGLRDGVPAKHANLARWMGLCSGSAPFTAVRRLGMRAAQICLVLELPPSVPQMFTVLEITRQHFG